MASKATVGSLRVALGLDSAQFTQGLTRAQMGLQRFGNIAKQGALMIGAAMVAAGGAMAVMMKGVIDEADKMSKLSQSIGVPIDELSRLRYAAELSGVELDGLGKAVQKLSVNMMEAGRNATGPAARAFTSLGIAVRDASGQMRPASQVVADLADRFQRMPNGVEKTALAVQVFGRAGASMIPMLNQGSAGLREMYEEAEQLGIVLDQETGRAAEAFNDNLTRLGKVKDGIITKITAGMLPALESLSASLVVAAKNSNLLKGVGAGLGWTLKALMSVALATAATFYALGKSIQIAATATYHFARGDFARASSTIVIEGTRVQMTLDSLNAMHAALWSGASGPPIVIDQLDGIAEATDRAARSTRGMTGAQREASEVARDLARDAAAAYDQTRTAAEKYADAIARLHELLETTGADGRPLIDQDTFDRRRRQIEEEFERDDPDYQALLALEAKKRQFHHDAQQRAMDFAADQRRYLEGATYDGIRGGLEAAADGGKYLAQRIRSALIDNLAGSLTDILMGGTKKGGSGGIGRLLGGALSFFGGGPKVPGFKTGGSFKVGGSGGADSQLMAFRASPGEMVDVRRPGQGLSGGGRPVHFDLRGAVMTSDLLQQMEGMALETGGAAFQGARQTVPADMARTNRYSLSGR